MQYFEPSEIPRFGEIGYENFATFQNINLTSMSNTSKTLAIRVRCLSRPEQWILQKGRKSEVGSSCEVKVSRLVDLENFQRPENCRNHLPKIQPHQKMKVLSEFAAPTEGIKVRLRLRSSGGRSASLCTGTRGEDFEMPTIHPEFSVTKSLQRKRNILLHHYQERNQAVKLRDSSRITIQSLQIIFIG